MIDPLLQDGATAHADRDPHSVALVMGPERMTYGELERAANRLAHALIAVGCGSGDRVGLLAPKAPAAIVAMLATLKVGAAYVPIDVASPTRRIARILSAVQPSAVLTVGPRGAAVAELRSLGAISADTPIGALDDTASLHPHDLAFGPEVLHAGDESPPVRRGRPEDLAHILFTSGSTGSPKGVTVTHAGVNAFLAWAVPHFSLQADDRVSSHPPLHFDLSTFDVFGALSVGATLHLVPERTLLPAQLADFIASAQLTQWLSVPSTMTYMAKFGGLPEHGFPSLRRVLWCGEVLPVPILAQWMERVPGASFTNLYGPTETVVASAYHTVSERPADDAEPVPIGRACAGEELLVLGDAGEPVATGEQGELFIGGSCVSPGYWRDAETTARAFVADPRPGRAGQTLYRTGDLASVDEHGVHHFHGRADDQIKSRGYRIELGEVEAALGHVPEVAEGAVVAIGSDGFEGSSICCAFTPAPGAEVDAIALRAALGKILPPYMLPSQWEAMDALPKNVNGKIDRRRITELFLARTVPETLPR